MNVNFFHELLFRNVLELKATPAKWLAMTNSFISDLIQSKE